jgi:hypothetical protein
MAILHDFALNESTSDDLQQTSLDHDCKQRTRRVATYVQHCKPGRVDFEEPIYEWPPLIQKAHEKKRETIITLELSWYALDHLFRANPDLAEQVWHEVKEQAARDFKSGHFAAELFERTDWQKNVWKRAHFVAVFQMMIESYKPRDAIEHQMVEMKEKIVWCRRSGERRPIQGNE